MNAALSIGEPAGVPAAAFIDHVSVVREMMARLETLTSAGQQYLMGKIIGFIDERGRGLLGDMGLCDRRAFTEQLTHLRRESDRAFPDVPNFVRWADGLMGLFEVGTPDQRSAG